MLGRIWRTVQRTARASSQAQVELAESWSSLTVLLLLLFASNSTIAFVRHLEHIRLSHTKE